MRSLLSIVVGLAVTILLFLAGQGLLAVAFFGATALGGAAPHFPPMSWVAARILVVALAGVFGGYSTALIANRRPTEHAGIVAICFALLFIVPAPAGPVEVHRTWYSVVATALGTIGVVAGGLLRSRARPSAAGQHDLVRL